ncbi:MAG: response regulator [Chitinophagales bacterium]|nr:response regulator [Chitinophagales bacterium]
MKKLKTILLVEDDTIAAIVCKRTIELNNYAENILIKGNGKEAIRYIQELIKENKPLPDVILLDINMPVMNGWDFLNEYEQVLKETNHPPPLIFILSSTANPDDFSKATLYECVKDFIPKPFKKEHISLIESYLEN